MQTCTVSMAHRDSPLEPKECLPHLQNRKKIESQITVAYELWRKPTDQGREENQRGTEW